MRAVLFQSVQDTVGRPAELTCRDLVDLCESPIVGDKTAAPLFIAGATAGNRRGKNDILTRTAVVLDSDHWADAATTLDDYLDLYPHPTFVWDTASSTPADRRRRVIIPLSRPCTPDEYRATARKAIGLLGGPASWDPSTVQPARLMYLPVSADGKPVPHRVRTQGKLLDPEPAPHTGTVQRKRVGFDDLPGGNIGRFCRNVDMPTAVEVFHLPYDETDSPYRWRYRGSHNMPGMISTDGGWHWYSHHTTDPACCGRYLNVFDIVRIHRYTGRKTGGTPETYEDRIQSTKVAIADLMNDHTEFFTERNN